MTRELSLAEETTLLLYGSVLNVDGALSDDVFSKYGESGSLVAGALLMDLVARGRLRMERPKPPERRARRDGWLWAMGMILLFIAAMFGPLAVTVWWRLLPVIPYTFASFPLCLLIILAANLRVALHTGYMVIVDTSPVGEEMLDAVLKGLMRIGLRKRPATYIRRYFDIVLLSKDPAYLRARLEWRRCVLPAASGKQSTFLGLVDVRHVDRAHPAFRAIGERVRRLLRCSLRTGSRASFSADAARARCTTSINSSPATRSQGLNVACAPSRRDKTRQSPHRWEATCMTHSLPS